MFSKKRFLGILLLMAIAGLISACGTSNSNQSPFNIGGSSVNSSNQQVNYINNLYNGLLGRPPQNSELSTWQASIITNNLGCAEIAAQFLSTPEFLGHEAPLSITNYLTALYLGILGRPIDSTGLAGYSAMLSSGTTRAAVASALLTSAEFNGSCAATFGFSAGAGTFTITATF